MEKIFAGCFRAVALPLTDSGMKSADKYAETMIKCTNVKKEKKGGQKYV